ncbi:MAG: hypothetical protein K2H74_00500 [Paramuribaculum sp.]|nr:hypothetical protein [Paramuribaculum sp.]
MKAYIITLAAILLGISAKASEMPCPSQTTSEASASDSPLVCQFSLTSYSGTINSGNTNTFQVGLSCPQQSDVRATVVVVIDKELVASKVVTIKAGNDYSDPVYISVGHSYNGQKYQLGVQ